MPSVPRRPRDDDDDDRRRDRDDEDRPRRSRDEEDEERPRRSRSREEEEDRPRRSRDDDDDRSSRSRRDRDEEEEDRSRRSRRDDDDDDDKGSRERGSVRSGWGGYKENKAKSGDFADELKIDKETELIKFLEDEPVASYRQHWIDNPPGDIRKKSWTCIETECPLCDLGDRPTVKTVFNIAHMNTGGEPINKVLVLGVKAVGQLLNFSEDRKTGPLTKLYYAVSKSGKSTSTAYNFRPCKDRDVEEDWSMDPLTDKELAALEEGVYGEKDVVQVQSRKQLKELADALRDDD